MPSCRFAIASSWLVGLCIAGLAAAEDARPQAGAYTFERLNRFDKATEGVHPNGDLVWGPDGALYGTNYFYGPFDAGTAYRITKSGKVTVLHAFGADGQDGVQPRGGMALASDGHLYGTTVAGGAAPEGYGGTVYRLTPAGEYTVLHSFSPNGDEVGFYPVGPPILASDGNFYGTTSRGGPVGCGAVYRMTPAGEVSAVKSFMDGPDGCAPWSKLLQARDGMLYGTTRVGGKDANKVGNGTVFRVTLDGAHEVMHIFRVFDGKRPVGNLIQGLDRKFYGATSLEGGANCMGTLYKLSPAGQFTLLHSFSYLGEAGYDPEGGLVQGSDGTLFGTNYDSGSDHGVVYSVSPTGDDVQVIYASDRAKINGGLALGPDGSLYGAYYLADMWHSGVFRLKPVSP